MALPISLPSLADLTQHSDASDLCLLSLLSGLIPSSILSLAQFHAYPSKPHSPVPAPDYDIKGDIRRPAREWLAYLRSRAINHGLLAKAQLVHRDPILAESLCSEKAYKTMPGLTYIHLSPIYSTTGPSWIDLTHPSDLCKPGFFPYHISGAHLPRNRIEDPLDSDAIATLGSLFTTPITVHIRVQRISKNWSFMISTQDVMFGHPLGSSQGENPAATSELPPLALSSALPSGRAWPSLYHLRTKAYSPLRTHNRTFHSDPQLNISA